MRRANPDLKFLIQSLSCNTNGRVWERFIDGIRISKNQMHQDSYPTASYDRPPVQSPASPFLLFSFLAPFSCSASRGPLLFSFLAPYSCSASKGPLLFSFLAPTSCSASRSPLLFSFLAPTSCSASWLPHSVQSFGSLFR